MEIDRGVHRCDHCGHQFLRPNLIGRKPQYCARTCRQRAYEARRRGQLRHGCPPTGLVEPLAHLRKAPSYERARSRARIHLLRPDGVPDRRRWRPTLCGSYGMPLPSNVLRTSTPPCRTCAAVADRHPAHHHHDAAVDVGILRALVGRFRLRGDEQAVIDDLLGYCFPSPRAAASA